MNSQIHKIIVDQKGVRVDVFLSSKLDSVSRTRIKKMITNGQILINNNIEKPSYLLTGGEHIHCDLKDSKEPIALVPQDIKLDILFEDDHFIVISKPAGMVVHPGNGNKENTLANGLLFYLKQSPNFESVRPGIVHRLDKDTSGVIVTAKNDTALQSLSDMFKDRRVSKTYEAIVWGKLNEFKGEIQNYLIRDNRDKTSFKVSNRSGKEAISFFEVIESLGPLTHVSLSPKTGRTHQLRVHMKHIGHPILADSKYSRGESMIKAFHTRYTQILKRCYKLSRRTMLHAKSISFIHPFTKKEMFFSVDLPSDMKGVITLLKNEI
tara:strand:+ start:97 stop:1062 length:966 start_codon:yes stop_codon:yes gene_type:complete